MEDCLCNLSVLFTWKSLKHTGGALSHISNKSCAPGDTTIHCLAIVILSSWGLIETSWIFGCSWFLIEVRTANHHDINLQARGQGIDLASKHRDFLFPRQIEFEQQMYIAGKILSWTPAERALLNYRRLQEAFQA